MSVASRWYVDGTARSRWAPISLAVTPSGLAATNSIARSARDTDWIVPATGGCVWVGSVWGVTPTDSRRRPLSEDPAERRVADELTRRPPGRARSARRAAHGTGRRCPRC